MANDPPKIGRKLRRAMERARMDQAQVAEALGVSRSAVNAWINDRAYPMNSIGALEDLLGVGLDGDDRQERPISLQQQLDQALRDLAEIRRQLEDQGNGNEESNGERRIS